MWFDFTADLRAAARSIRHAPGASALIVLTLAIAIGAATIGFTFADLALLRGLPVDDPSRVVSVFASDTRGSNPRARVSGPDFLDYRSNLRSLEFMSAFREGRAPLITNGQSQTLFVSYATADLFVSMGQAPVAGRAFLPGEDQPGAAPVMLLSHRYWRDHMGGRPDVIGRSVQVGRDLVTIVGVMPPQLEFGSLAQIDVWMPLHLSADGARDARDLRFIARLKDGVSFEQAAAEMAALGQRLAGEHPLSNAGWTMRLVPVRDLTGGDGFWVTIALFLLSIGLLIAIATANVSNLIMVRAAARTKELAVRTALGARGGRLLRQFITEGFVLAVLAAILALPLAYGGLQVIAAVSDDGVFRQLRIDLPELAFVAMLALVCPIVFTLAPARVIARPDMRQVLASQGARGATASLRGRRALVVAQVALAVILLVASSLVLKSIRLAYATPLGMTIDQLLVFGLDFNDVAYPEPAQAESAIVALRDAFAGVPGVQAASVLDGLPVLGDRAETALVLDHEPPLPGEATRSAVVTRADAAAGAVLGVRLLAGKWWQEGETGAAVITRAAAERYFGGVQAAIGRPLATGTGQARADYRVAGVADDIANTNRTMAPPPRVWVPRAASRRVTFVLQGADPAALAPAVRAVAAARAPTLPLEDLRTFPESLRRAESSDYVVIGLLAAFSGVALLLAVTGLFGVVSYSVAQRVPEFGTRIALGASAASVVRQVAGQSLGLLAIGLAIGLAGGVIVGFLMQGALFGTTPTDPATLLGVSALLTVVTLAATALPAWRASRIDPVVALRE